MTLQVTVDLEETTCAECGTVFAMIYAKGLDLRERHGTFYCPNGHTLSFKAKSDLDKARDENRDLRRQLADIEDQRARAKMLREKRKTKLRAVS